MMYKIGLSENTSSNKIGIADARASTVFGMEDLVNGFNYYYGGQQNL